MKIESFCRKWGLLFFLLIMFGCNSSSGGGDNPDGRDTQSPSKPEVVSAPEISAGRVALSWPSAPDNVGVARYRIYRNGAMIAESGETSYIDTALSDPGQYCYSVSAIDEAGNESEQSPSTCVEVPPQPDTEPPSVPSGVSASVTDSGARITWSVSNDNKAVAGYRIFRNGVKISDVAETSFSDSSVSAGTRYCYTVSAFDASNNESAQSFESCIDSPVARDVQPPSVPANLKCTSSASSHDLSWSASSDNIAVTGYKIYKNNAYITTVTSTSFSDTGVSGADQICYFIMAFDAAGNESQKSDQTCVASVAGKTKWKVEIDDQINTNMALSSDGTLYLITSKGTLYAIGSDGTIKWKYFKEDSQGLFAMYFPAVGNGGTVYWGANQYLYANNADGTLKWKAKINQWTNSYDSTPAIGPDGTVYVNATDFLMLNPDGTLKKRINTSNCGYSPIIGHDGTIYEQLQAYYPDGNEKNVDPNSYAEPLAINYDGSFYSVSVYRHDFGGIVGGYFISANPDYSEKWKIFPPESSIRFFSPAVGSDETVYTATSDGYLNAFSVSGILKWKNNVAPQMLDEPLRLNSFTPAIGSDGTIYVQSSTGLHALNKDGVELWTNQDATGSSCPLISADGTIYVSSGKTVYAVYSDSRGLASSSWPRYRKDNGNTGNGVNNTPDATPPSSPTNLTAVAQTQSMTKLDWNVSVGSLNQIKGYKIYRNGEYVGSISKNEYIDSGLSPSTSYCYRVVAVDFAEKESSGADVCVRTRPEASVGELKWKYTYIPGVYGYVSPTLLGDGSVLAVGKYSINPAKGTLKWVSQTDTSVPASVAPDSSIYLGPYFCLNIDGSLRWSKNQSLSPGYYPAAVGSDGGVYFGTSNGFLYAFNSDGTEKWLFDTGTNDIIKTIAIASDGTLYATSLQKGLLCAIRSDGTLKWKFDAYLLNDGFLHEGTDYYCRTSEVSIGADGTVYLVSVSTSKSVLFAIKPDGTRKWEYQANQNGAVLETVSPTIDPAGTIYVGGDALRAINYDGTLKWERKTDNFYASTPVIGKDGVLYSLSNSGLEATNPDGTLKWQYQCFIRQVGACLIAADGTLYFDTGLEINAIQTSSMGLATGGWPNIYHDNQNTSRMP